MSVKIGNFRDDSIAPKFFEIVSVTGFRDKNMNEYVSVINHNPFRIGISVIIVRFY